MVEAANTFVWVIGNFQDYVKRTSKGESFTSPRFWMPQKCDDTKPTLWRLHLYPNGDLGAENDQISVSLEAIRTPFEKLNDVNKREQRHKIGIGRSIVRSSDSSKTMIKAITSDQHHYDLNRPSATWNLENFIPLDEVFPGRNRSQPTDIFIQITLIDPDEGFETDERVYKRFKELYDDDSLADVEFTFDCDKKVKAHRIILAMESEYFKQKFQGEWKEEKVIRMEGTNCCAFRAVVYFIYTGRFLFKGSVGCCGLIHFYNEVHKLAEMMKLDKLKLLIAEEMPRSINDRNWDKFLSLGWKTKNQFLKDTVLEYVVKNWEKVKKGEGMRRLLIVANDEVEELEELFSIVSKRKQMAKWPDDRLPRPNVRIVRRI